MPEYITREEFDMYVKNQEKSSEALMEKLTHIGEGQEKMLANAADHKALHVGYNSDIATVKIAVADIKDDKRWLVRLVTGTMCIGGLCALGKFLFG